MARVLKAHPHIVVGLEFLAIGNVVELFQTRLRLGDGIERRDIGARALALFVASFVLPQGFGFLDMGAVEQHHLQQIDAGVGRVNRPLKTKGAQTWQQTRMIGVGVGEQHKIDFVRLELESREILAIGCRTALKQTAVNNKFDVISSNQIAGAGDFLRRA